MFMPCYKPPKTAATKAISFADITRGRGTHVRVTDDEYLYVVDLVMVMIDRDRHCANATSYFFGHCIFDERKYIDRNIRGKKQTIA
jgi:hypothetical protein